MLQTISRWYNLPPKIERIIFNISLIITIIVIISGIIVLGWYLQPSKIITIYNEPIPTVQTGIKAGKLVIFKIKYCKASSQMGYVTWYIVGSSSITFLPPYTDVTGKSCGTVLDPVTIPPQIKPGTYYIVWQVSYNINPLKQDYTEFRSRDFQVQ